MLVQRVVLLLLIALQSLFVGFTAYARLPEACGGPTVRQLQWEVLGRQITYRYAYREGVSEDAPVVVYLPGGPGQGGIGLPLSLPYEYGIVRTDPIGAGCNADANLPVEEITSDLIADGVVRLIRELRPRRYLLYGVSYGTMVATLVAEKLAHSELPPEAVILEGVIGRAFTAEESLRGFQNEWSRLKTKLPAESRRALEHDDLPFDFAPEIWGGWIQNLLLCGASPSGGEGFAAETLSLLAAPAGDRRLEFLRRQLSLFSQPSDPAHVALYRSIACREIDDHVRGQKTDMVLKGGRLIPLASDFCGPRRLSRPFDAAAHPILAPIFYFSGGADPATPEFQTRYHFESQSGPRAWVRIPSGGHLSLSNNLMLCQDAIWQDIVTNSGRHLEEVVSGCQSQPPPEVFRR